MPESRALQPADIRGFDGLKGQKYPTGREEETEGQDGGDKSAMVSVYLVLGRHTASVNPWEFNLWPEIY